MENKPRVLILEPDFMHRDLIGMALKRANLEPVLVEDAAALPELLRSNPARLLILSIHLPGTNGLDLMGELNAKGLLKHTRVLVISSLGFPEIVRKALAAGAADFLVKPIDPATLEARTRQLMGG